MNNLRDGTVKAFCVNASFQSINDVQRKHLSEVTATRSSERPAFHARPQLGIVPLMLLHDEISVLVGGTLRKILAIRANANNLQDVYSVRTALPQAGPPSARPDGKSAILCIYE